MYVGFSSLDSLGSLLPVQIFSVKLNQHFNPASLI